MWKLSIVLGVILMGMVIIIYYVLLLVLVIFSLEKVEGKNEHAVDDPEEIASMVDM